MSKHVKNIFTVAHTVSCSIRLNQTSFSQLVKSYVFHYLMNVQENLISMCKVSHQRLVLEQR